MNLKVLHLNVTDAGGGVGKAAFRLHRLLNNRGVDSWMLVDHKFTADEKVIPTASGFVSKLYSRFRSNFDKLPSKLSGTQHWEYASFNFLPNPAVRRWIRRLQPDILHLHWIGDGYLPLQYFPELSDIPTLATLHGRWLFNGAQHLHSDQSVRFVEGFRRDNRDNLDSGIDVDRWVWERKLKCFESNPFEVVALSEWMQRDAARSVLLKNRAIHLVPNGLDLSLFHPVAVNEARSKLGLPQARKLVLFGANFATQDRNKGYFDFVEAIQFLETRKHSEFEVVVFGSDRPSGEMPFQTPIHFLGYLKNESDLVNAYSACDCFVLPSHQDNLPNTVMESLACGTPCVAYNVGGVSDMVENSRNGYLVPPRDTSSLAESILRLLSLNAPNIASFSNHAVAKIEKEFDQEKQVEKMIITYDSVVKRNLKT